MSETEIQRQILEALALIPGVYAWRNNTGAIQRMGRFVRFGITGQGDITGVLPGGRRLEIEVKVPKAEPSEEQVKFGARINAAGGLWFVAHSLEEALQAVYAAIGKEAE